MKRIITFLLFCIIPINLLASNLLEAVDSCTKPDKYKIDKRCYVTEIQKKQKPFNAVVGIVTGPSSTPFCTGTIVEQNDQIYIYTAKHCSDINEDGISDEELLFKTQNGETFVSDKYKVGVYDIKGDTKLRGDFAIYRIDTGIRDIDELPYVQLTTKKSPSSTEYYDALTPFITSKYKAKSVGYGILKIMSDEQIQLFKSKYLNYLKKAYEASPEEIQKNKSIYGFLDNGGINVLRDKKYGGNSYVIGFLLYLEDLENRYYNDIFQDHDLKISNCEYLSNGKMINCQIWGGNSGGPLFDDSGDIMGIATRATRTIGGSGHAGKTDNDTNVTVPLFGWRYFFEMVNKQNTKRKNK
jgi:V8-like Glu-specific endopeptidase